MGNKAGSRETTLETTAIIQTRGTVGLDQYGGVRSGWIWICFDVGQTGFANGS